jgi:hypothetical protein
MPIEKRATIERRISFFMVYNQSFEGSGPILA